MYLKELFSMKEEALKHSYLLSIGHNLSDGKFREELIKTILDTIPNRYCIKNGFVIDSEGNKSLEIDLIIFDDVYVPKLFMNTYSVIPIESVVAVVQVKTKLTKQELTSSINNLASIDKLIPKKNGSIVSAIDGNEKFEKRSIAPLKFLVAGECMTKIENSKVSSLDIIYPVGGKNNNSLKVKVLSNQEIVSIDKSYEEQITIKKSVNDFKEYKNNKLFNFTFSVLKMLTLINNSMIVNYNEYLKEINYTKSSENNE